MAQRSTKRQQARELAMAALANKIDEHNTIISATEDAFLAQVAFTIARSAFADKLQTLQKLGQDKTDLAQAFGLTTAELRALLSLDLTQITNKHDTHTPHNADDHNHHEHIDSND